MDLCQLLGSWTMPTSTAKSFGAKFCFLLQGYEAIDPKLVKTSLESRFTPLGSLGKPANPPSRSRPPKHLRRLQGTVETIVKHWHRILQLIRKKKHTHSSTFIDLHRLATQLTNNDEQLLEHDTQERGTPWYPLKQGKNTQLLDT